jgi:hypothetical protein
MPYERDPDHMTRGVGAIAAADHVSSARHRRRVQIGRDLRRRDRAMSAIAQGALGMVVAGDQASTTTPYKPALRLPARGTLVHATIPVMPGLILQKPPSPAPPMTTPPIIAPVPPVVALPPVVTPLPAPLPATIRVAPVTVSSGITPPIRASSTFPSIIATAPTMTEVPTDQDHSTRNVVLLAAGAGALAYFLFFRRRT